MMSWWDFGESRGSPDKSSRHIKSVARFARKREILKLNIIFEKKILLVKN